MTTQLEHCIATSHNLTDGSISFLAGLSLTVSESESTLSEMPLDLFLVHLKFVEYLAAPEISHHELLAWQVGFLLYRQMLFTSMLTWHQGWDEFPLLKTLVHDYARASAPHS